MSIKQFIKLSFNASTRCNNSLCTQLREQQGQAENHDDDDDENHVLIKKCVIGRQKELGSSQMRGSPSRLSSAQPLAAHCTELRACSSSRARAWNGREHGVWEQREMKRMIANIVWTETWPHTGGSERRRDLRTEQRLGCFNCRTKTSYWAKSHQGNGCISNAWNMANEFRAEEYAVLCYGVNLGELNGEKMLEFYTSWVGEWSIDKIVPKAILKSFGQKSSLIYKSPIENWT